MKYTIDDRNIIPDFIKNMSPTELRREIVKLEKEEKKAAHDINTKPISPPLPAQNFLSPGA
jgi:hypothetical protein